MINLGYLHSGELFMLDGIVYTAGQTDGNGNAWVINLENGKREKLSLDTEVEEKEQKE